MSPHLAAELAGITIEPRELVEAAREQARADDGEGVLVCEGVGGLMVPITPGYLVRDLAIDLAPAGGRSPLARASARSTTRCSPRGGAARAGSTVAAVVMTPWPDDPTPMERSNRDTIARLGDVRVTGLPRTTPDRLAEAGASLPVEDWL